MAKNLKLSNDDISLVDKCPRCFRLICKRTKMDTGDGKGESSIISIKHRGASILANTAVIMCPSCKAWYLVDAKTGIVQKMEVN